MYRRAARVAELVSRRTLDAPLSSCDCDSGSGGV